MLHLGNSRVSGWSPATYSWKLKNQLITTLAHGQESIQSLYCNSLHNICDKDWRTLLYYLNFIYQQEQKKSFLGPALFSIFVGGTDSKIECTLTPIYMMPSRETLTGFKGGKACANFMKLNKAKCKVPYQPLCISTDKDEWMESNHVEKDLGYWWT